MKLSEFVESTLLQIIQGVAAAQSKTKIEGRSPKEADLVNPPVLNQADNAPKNKHYTTIKRDLVQMVDFDVAVTVSRDSAQEGGAGINIAGLGGFGGKLKDGESLSEVSRIKFQVPIILPSSEHNDG